MIELTFFSGMTHPEIAIKLGQSPEAIGERPPIRNNAAFRHLQIHEFCPAALDMDQGSETIRQFHR
ncbi:MAG TPA: hypothetical protein VJ124_01730, partial [Pyrinomonadaceae bacterium]|nr:hypothetical protein [Pyrinomonadaceae bacterium]